MQNKIISEKLIVSLGQDIVYEKIINVLSNDGLVVFPSDTVLGVFAKISTGAISKLDKFKNRPNNKNYSLIVSDLTQLHQKVELSAKNIDVIKKNVPGFFTFVVKPKKIIDQKLNLILSPEHKLGFRIPTSNLMLEVASRSSFSILATSANLSGQPSVYSWNNLEDQFTSNDLLDHLNLLDLVINFDIPGKCLSSTVVDLTTTPPAILREGSGKLICS